MLLGLGLILAVTVVYAPVSAPVPVLNSYWLIVHVAAAIIAGAASSPSAPSQPPCFAPGTAREAGRHRPGPVPIGCRRGPWTRSRTPRTSSRSPSGPSPSSPAQSGPKTPGAGTGAGTPKETWAFITWVLYAAYLHAQSTAGWKGVKASLFGVTGYLAFLFNFFGVKLWISGLHSYAGV